MSSNRNKTPPLILASASPRRQELLAQIGVNCSVHPVNLDETMDPGESPRAYVERLALDKARACRDLATTPDDAVFLGADTTVVVDGDVLGKPSDREDGISMLRRLSGREHEVLTAVAAACGKREAVRCSTSRVGFAKLSDASITAYWETGESADKAGAYGIQGFAAAFINYMAGSYSGIVGLPLYETAELLREFGMDVMKLETGGRRQ